jgi:hypothetical protein
MIEKQLKESENAFLGADRIFGHHSQKIEDIVQFDRALRTIGVKKFCKNMLSSNCLNRLRLTDKIKIRVIHTGFSLDEDRV